jgi:DNA replication protein DnaC
MRGLRLPHARAIAADVLATARAQRWDPAEVLRLLIAEEVIGRDAATRRLRRHSANFPTGKTLASWRAEDSTIPEPTQNSLVTLEWIGRAENLVIAGPGVINGSVSADR